MKISYLDVRVKDQRGRSYIVEMQVLNVEGFEKRVLYNACKAYVLQLGKGDEYNALTEVVAVTITDFTMFPELGQTISRFRLRAEENPLISHQDLELVFAELPKFTKSDTQLETTLDRWLYFLKTAKDLTAIPNALAVEPAIVHAFEIANRAAWSQEELDNQEKREFWIYDQRTMLDRTARKARALGQAEGKAEGETVGKANTLLRLLRRRFKTLPADIEERVRAASSDQLDEWTDRFVDACELADVFGTDSTH
ncbi:transposase [uncultured Gammaproteobacteria bacterium]